MKCICVFENRAFLNIQCNFAFIIVHYPYFIGKYYSDEHLHQQHVHKINDNNYIQL